MINETKNVETKTNETKRQLSLPKVATSLKAGQRGSVPPEVGADCPSSTR
jgi:hypothetical protein